LNCGAKRELRKIRLADWVHLARGVFEYNVTSRFRPLAPKVMTAVVTYRCNARCAMCNIWHSPAHPEMSVEEFGRVLADPIFDTIERLTVSGGEPSLRTDLVALTGMFVERMRRLRALSLVSNGLLPERILADAEAMLAIARPRNIGFNISISLDGVGTDHDRVRGVEGAFDKVLATLDGLKRLRQGHDFWMGVGFTLMRENLTSAREFRCWAEEHDLEVGFVPVGFHGSYVSNLDLQDRIDFRAEEKDELFAFMQELGTRRMLFDPSAFYWSDMVRVYRDGADRTTPCPYNMDGLALDCHGDVFYCLSTSKIGNCLSGRSVSEIYYDSDNLRYRAGAMRGDICSKCNSGCAVHVALKKDLKKYLRFLVTR